MSEGAAGGAAAAAPAPAPARFMCPIMCEVMRDPVMTKRGINYERAAILAWLQRGTGTCPSTRQSLTADDIFPNIALREEIAEWRRASGGGGGGDGSAADPTAEETAAAVARVEERGQLAPVPAGASAEGQPLTLGEAAVVQKDPERLRELCCLRFERGEALDLTDVWNPAMEQAAGKEGTIARVDLGDGTVFVQLVGGGGWWLPVTALSPPGGGAYRWPPQPGDLKPKR